jgi:hypothetical protein
MTDQASRTNADAMQYAQTAMKWYGWGSPVGLGLFILAVGGFVALLHVAAVIP